MTVFFFFFNLVFVFGLKEYKVNVFGEGPVLRIGEPREMDKSILLLFHLQAPGKDIPA